VSEAKESETQDDGIDEDLLRRSSRMVNGASDQSREWSSWSYEEAIFRTERLTIKDWAEFRRSGHAHGRKRIAELTGSLFLRRGTVPHVATLGGRRHRKQACVRIKAERL